MNFDGSVNRGFSPGGLSIFYGNDYSSDSEDHSYRDSSDGIDAYESDSSCSSEIEMAVEGASLGVSQPEDDLAGVNSMLSTSDKLFLVFIGNVLKDCLHDEDGISITPSNDLQLKFDEWLKMHGVKADDSKEYSVDATIQSIWTTSRDFFVYLSIEACNTELATNEMEKQIKIGNISLEYQKQECGPKAFTQRQVQLMHILAMRNAF